LKHRNEKPPRRRERRGGFFVALRDREVIDGCIGLVASTMQSCRVDR
jgi:hypothetical protein